jgi:hypothetical protein
MQRNYPQAVLLYGEIRELRRAAEISLALERCGLNLDLATATGQP